MRTLLISFSIILLAFALVAAGVEVEPSPPLPRSAGTTAAAGSLIDPEECLICHDDEGLTMDKNGREISLDIDPEEYDDSMHGGLDCTDCHEGFDPEELPHKENIGPVDCSQCHEEASADFARSSHEGEILCSSCHGDVHVATTVLADQETCMTCHDEAFEEVAGSVHGQTDVGAGCLDCHSPHETRGVEADRCLDCHGSEEFVAENIPDEDAQEIASFRDSVHEGILDCSDCHEGHTIQPSDSPDSPVARTHIAETCAECHDEVAETYLESEHGQALAEGFDHAPTCTDCHGEHDIHTITDAESHISRATEVQVCLDCHLDAEDVRERMTHTGIFVGSYVESAHGMEAAAGNEDAAVCSDCHGAHGALKASNPESPIHFSNILETCSTCHEEVAGTFTESTHGIAILQGNDDAPTCTTCHGEHAIAETEDEDARVLTSSEGIQPLAGVYSTVCNDRLQDYLKTGNRMVFGFLNRLNYSTITVSNSELKNVNTPEDLGN